MGQYYKPYLQFADGKEEAYNSQNVIYKTLHGTAPDEGPCKFTEEGGFWHPAGYFDTFIGLKLLEHSWYGNDLVNGILERIEGRPARIAWVGDYADAESYFREVDGYTPEVYEKVWGHSGESGCLPDMPFPAMPGDHPNGCLVNHSKGLFIDLSAYRDAAKAKSDGRWWCVHPLPLLTAIGNGRGGGDYFQWNCLTGACGNAKNSDMVGSWAMDLIEYTPGKPDGGCVEVDYGRYAFDSMV